jgi:hypothetical protein
MIMSSYEKDYEATMAAKEAALRKIDQLNVEIDGLDERIRALETLIRADYPHKGKQVLDRDTTPAQAIVNVVQPRSTERVRGLLTAASGPLTSGEIHERLKQLGLDLYPQSNPWALIHGICRRLVDQQFAREVEKDGRKAWVLAKR